MLNTVKDFGACGDEDSDDRVAIQVAIDEAVAHHKNCPNVDNCNGRFRKFPHQRGSYCSRDG